MSEHQSQLTQEGPAAYERVKGGPDAAIYLSRSLERGPDNPSWLALSATYVDSEGRQGYLERDIHESCFEQIGRFTEPPVALPEVDKLRLNEKDLTVRLLQEKAHKEATQYALSGEAARLYTRGVLGESLNGIEESTIKRIVNELVTVAVQAHEARKQAEQL